MHIDVDAGSVGVIISNSSSINLNSAERGGAICATGSDADRLIVNLTVQGYSSVSGNVADMWRGHLH